MAAAPLSTLLAASASVWRTRPVVLAALGAATVLSLMAVCCGVGFITAPWFVCEMFALQLNELGGRPTERGPSWIAAGLLLVCAVFLVASVGWLTVLGFGAETPPVGPPRPLAWTEIAQGGGSLAALASAGAAGFVLPFMFAPLILVEKRAGLGGAVLESARLVLDGGVARHLGISFLSNGLQVVPLALAALVAALWLSPELVPVALLASLPLLAFTVPLGQGVVVATYVSTRDGATDLARARTVNQPPRALALLWLAVCLGPLLAFATLGASLARPSHLAEGTLPPQALRVASFDVSAPQRHYLEDTPLELHTNLGAVRVVAPDGGGTGTLPLRGEGNVEHVRVARQRDAYAIEVVRGGVAYLTWVTRAGVRLDDGLQRRLLDRASLHEIALLIATLLATAIAMLPTLASLGRLRRAYALPVAERLRPAALTALRERTLRRAWAVALVLLVPNALALGFGVSRLAGWG
jgi:hypothetical protein